MLHIITRMCPFTTKSWKRYVFFLCCLIYLVSGDEDEKKYEEAKEVATNTVSVIVTLFLDCFSTTMPNQQFALDNLQRYIYSPAKTTVGFAPKFTTNRKFFANMLASAPFKEMLARDEDELRKDFIRKMKFCCSAIMDPNILRDLYDREVDQSKQ